MNTQIKTIILKFKQCSFRVVKEGRRRPLFLLGDIIHCFRLHALDRTAYELNQAFDNLPEKKASGVVFGYYNSQQNIAMVIEINAVTIQGAMRLGQLFNRSDFKLWLEEEVAPTIRNIYRATPKEILFSNSVQLSEDAKPSDAETIQLTRICKALGQDCISLGRDISRPEDEALMNFEIH